MEFHFTTKLEEYYQKFVELQEKLKKSEEQRFLLEMKFNEIVQVAKEEEQAHYKKLRSQYKRFLEEDKKRQDRNERIIRSLERVETRISLLSAKTERIDILRRQYQSFLLRATDPNLSRKLPRERSFIKEKPLREQQGAFFKDEFSLPQTVDLKKPLFENPPLERDRSNDEKIEILDKYLQSISSQKCRDLLSRDKEAREKLALGTRPDGFLADDAPSRNHATVIADDIMNSIYLRYYNKDVKTDNLTKTTKDSGNSDNYLCDDGNKITRTQEHGEKTNSKDADKNETSNEQKENDSRILLKRAEQEQDENEKLNIASRAHTQITDEMAALNGSHRNEIINTGVKKQRSHAKEEMTSHCSEQQYAKETNYDQNVLYQKYHPQHNEDIEIYSNDRLRTKSHQKPESHSQNEQFFENGQHEHQGAVQLRGTINDKYDESELAKPYHSEPNQNFNVQQHGLNQSHKTEQYQVQVQDQVSLHNQNALNNLNQKEQLLPTIRTFDNQNKEPMSVEQPSYVPKEETFCNRKPVSPEQPSSDQNEQPISVVQPSYDPSEQAPYHQNERPMPAVQPSDDSYQNEPRKPIRQPSYDHNGPPSAMVAQSSFDEKELQFMNVQQQPTYGHNGQPMNDMQPSYDQNGPAMPTYSPNEQQPCFDQNEQPMIARQSSNGYNEQPSYAHNGQPMTVVQPPYDQNGQTLPTGQPSYDSPNEQLVSVRQPSFDQNEQPTIVRQPSYEHNEQVSYKHDGSSLPAVEQATPIVQPSNNDSNEKTCHDQNESVMSVQQTSYDENQQPMPVAQLPFDQNEQPKFVGQASYDQNEQLLNYDQTDPSYGQAYNENDQPIQYDRHGQDINEYDPNAQLTDYDQYGQFYLYDEHGQVVQPQYDENGQIIPQYDENGQLIMLYDQNGQPYTGDQYKSDQQQYDENGQALAQYEAEGQPVYQQNYEYMNQDQYGNQDYHRMEPERNNSETNENQNKEEEVKPIMTDEGDETKEPRKMCNVMDILDTDTEGSKPDTSKISNDTDFDFS